jgi:hypothetical protein
MGFRPTESHLNLSFLRKFLNVSSAFETIEKREKEREIERGK